MLGKLEKNSNGPRDTVSPPIKHTIRRPTTGSRHVGCPVLMSLVMGPEILKRLVISFVLPYRVYGMCSQKAL